MDRNIKAYYPYLDLLKFICCIGIVAIHVNPFFYINAANYYFSNIANIFIAIFFVVSSLLFWRKIKWNNSDWKTIWNFSKRLLILLVAWGIILAPHWFTLFLHTFRDHGGYNLLGALILRLLTSGTCLGSWFIVSLIFGTIIVYLLNRYFNKHIAFLIIFVIWLYHSLVRYEGMPDFLNIYFFGEYYNGKSINSSFLPQRAIFWLEAGYYLVPYLQRLQERTNHLWLYIGAVFVSFICSSMPHFYFVSNMVISILIPFICISIKNENASFKTLRNISIIVYFVHRPIYTGFEILYKKISYGTTKVLYFSRWHYLYLSL